MNREIFRYKGKDHKVFIINDEYNGNHVKLHRLIWEKDNGGMLSG